jgi:hypothetical protein
VAVLRAGCVRDSNELALGESPVVAPLREFTAFSKQWTGTATELLDELNNLAGEKTIAGKDWPKRPNALSGLLRRLAPSARKTGLNVSFLTTHNHTGQIRLSSVKVAEGSPPPPPAPRGRENAAKRGTAAKGTPREIAPAIAPRRGDRPRHRPRKTAGIAAKPPLPGRRGRRGR